MEPSRLMGDLSPSTSSSSMAGQPPGARVDKVSRWIGVAAVVWLARTQREPAVRADQFNRRWWW